MCLTATIKYLFCSFIFCFMLTNPIYTKNKCVSYINVFHIFTSAGILINVNYTYIYGVIQSIYKTIIIIIIIIIVIIIFELDQKKIYAELNRNGIRSNDVPNAEQCTKEHSREAKWLNDLKRERERVNDKHPQERVSISVEKKKKQC